MDSKLRNDLIKIIGNHEFEKKYENYKHTIKKNDDLSNDMYQDFLDSSFAGSIYKENGDHQKAEEQFRKAKQYKSDFHEDFINQKRNFYSNVFLQDDSN